MQPVVLICDTLLVFNLSLACNLLRLSVIHYWFSSSHWCATYCAYLRYITGIQSVTEVQPITLICDTLPVFNQSLVCSLLRLSVMHCRYSICHRCVAYCAYLRYITGIQSVSGVQPIALICDTLPVFNQSLVCNLLCLSVIHYWYSISHWCVAYCAYL